MSELEIVEQGTDSEDESESEGEESETDEEPTEGGKSVSQENLVDQVLEQVVQDIEEEDEEEEAEEERIYAVEPIQVIKKMTFLKYGMISKLSLFDYFRWPTKVPTQSVYSNQIEAFCEDRLG